MPAIRHPLVGRSFHGLQKERRWVELEPCTREHGASQKLEGRDLSLACVAGCACAFALPVGAARFSNRHVRREGDARWNLPPTGFAANRLLPLVCPFS